MLRCGARIRYALFLVRVLEGVVDEDVDYDLSESESTPLSTPSSAFDLSAHRQSCPGCRLKRESTHGSVKSYESLAAIRVGSESSALRLAACGGFNHPTLATSSISATAFPTSRPCRTPRPRRVSHASASDPYVTASTSPRFVWTSSPDCVAE